MIICEYVKSIMEKFSVVLFAIFTCICYATGLVEFSFNDILKEVCMVFFFTSVGFQANLKVLKSGGKALIVFLGLVIVLTVSQNFLAVGLAKLMHISPLIGLCTGSIPMVQQVLSDRFLRTSELREQVHFVPQVQPSV